MDTAQLIERCKTGDQDALGALYMAYLPEMRRVCRRYISNEQTVSDVVHDAFVIIITSLDKLRNPQRAEQWMMAIVKGVALRQVRHQGQPSTVPLEAIHAELYSVEEQGAPGISVEKLMQMVEHLPEGYRQVFRLSMFEGMSHKDIALLLGIEPHSSSSQLMRAKKMLRGMIRQYWLLVLIPMVCLIGLWLHRNSDKAGRPAQARHATVEQEQQNAQVAQARETTDNPVRKPQYASKPQHAIAADTIRKAAPAITLPQAQPIHQDSMPAMRIPHIKIPASSIHLARKKRTNRRWSMNLAYGSMPASGNSVVDNFMTVTNYADNNTRSMQLYNWGDYVNYVNTYRDQMDSVDAANMQYIISQHTHRPDEPLSEYKYHVRPRTIQLSMSYPLSCRWTLTTGISYSRLKSTFESGDDNTLTRRTQKLHYIGIPLKLTYGIIQKPRWQAYLTGGLQIDIPVSGRLRTDYIYNGPYAPQNRDSLFYPTSRVPVSAPWHWSVGAGAGVQYKLLPHIYLYVEPTVRYNIPTGSDIESYWTQHPFDVSVPFGLRFSW